MLPTASGSVRSSPPFDRSIIDAFIWSGWLSSRSIPILWEFFSASCCGGHGQNGYSRIGPPLARIDERYYLLTSRHGSAAIRLDLKGKWRGGGGVERRDWRRRVRSKEMCDPQDQDREEVARKASRQKGSNIPPRPPQPSSGASPDDAYLPRPTLVSYVDRPRGRRAARCRGPTSPRSGAPSDESSPKARNG
jgi:hypothetical protein